MEAMNAKIRKRVRIALVEQEKTQRKLAEDLKMHPQYVNDLLTGRVGHIPTAWSKVLDAVGLELVAVPKQGETKDA